MEKGGCQRSIDRSYERCVGEELSEHLPLHLPPDTRMQVPTGGTAVLLARLVEETGWYLPESQTGFSQGGSELLQH